MGAAACAAMVLALGACSRESKDPSPARAAPSEALEPAPASPPGSEERSAEPAATAESIDWLADEGRALTRSASTGRPVLIDFSAEWCAPCEEMERVTFADPAVRALVEDRLVPLKIDATEMDDASAAVMKKYGVTQLPVILVRRPDGEDLLRFSDFVGPQRFVAEIERALAARSPRPVR